MTPIPAWHQGVEGHYFLSALSDEPPRARIIGSKQRYPGQEQIAVGQMLCLRSPDAASLSLRFPVMTSDGEGGPSLEKSH
jgi:hypothetical protein